MSPTVFASQPLPEPLARVVRRRLAAAHEREPFSALDARGTVQRVVAAIADLDVTTTVYRGGVDLRGAEVDHVWLELAAGVRERWVIDAAFPLFLETFVDVLRRYVAGDAPPEDLAAAAGRGGLGERVVGVFPRPVRYVGRPIWSARA